MPPGFTAIFNPRDPKAVLAEFTMLFALPPSLSQVQSHGLKRTPGNGLKRTPGKGRRGNSGLEWKDGVRMRPLVLGVNLAELKQFLWLPRDKSHSPRYVERI